MAKTLSENALPDFNSVSSGGTKPSLSPDDGRLRRGRRSRSRILSAARELFEERGFDNSTLRAIAKRAGMGTSSIYRHVQSKEELLIDGLAMLQEEAWRNFRQTDNRKATPRSRVSRFLDFQHALLAEDSDLTLIALRATTRPGVRVASQVLALDDRAIGLLMEILQMGRMQGQLESDVDVLEAARVILNITQGARIPWANGMTNAESCRQAIETGINMLFRGLEKRPQSDSSVD
jgi:AcrR family transcriptional regulator